MASVHSTHAPVPVQSLPVEFGCPECGGELVEYDDPATGKTLVCIDCTPFAPTDDAAPEADVSRCVGCVAKPANVVPKRGRKCDECKAGLRRYTALRRELFRKADPAGRKKVHRVSLPRESE